MFFPKFADNLFMVIEGVSIAEITKKLKITRQAAETRLSRAGIKPVFAGYLYPLDTIDKIKVVNKGGRPKKDTNKAKCKP